MPGPPSRWSSEARHGLIAWAGGVAAAVIVLGPALQPGGLLNLDLVLTPHFPVPHGVWGLGPELPQRMPLGLLMAWLSWLVGGPNAGKTLFVVSIAAAFAGADRLSKGTPAPCRLGAGAVYALSPFMLTRVGVGHFNVVAPAAILPWALPHLLTPDRNVARTALWAAALGATGSVGGVLTIIVVLAGLVATRARRLAPIAGVVVLGQLGWLVPSLVALSAHPQLADARQLATRLEGPFGVLRLIAGHGFWRAASQAGGRGGAAVPLLGAALLALAVWGTPELAARHGWRMVVLAGVGFSFAAASGIGPLRGVAGLISRSPLGAPLRESQRALLLTLVWLAPAAAHGAARLARSVRAELGPTMAVLPIALALLLGAPGLWGVQGALSPLQFPAAWSQARSLVRHAPGTVLALPWHEYLDLKFAHQRRVLNPVPFYFENDVLTSSDPELDSPHHEGVDARESAADRVIAEVLAGRPAGSDLQKLGVRWVLLLHESDYTAYGSVRNDPTLQLRLTSGALELFEVSGWQGPVVDDFGHAVKQHDLASPLKRLAPSPRATADMAATGGWLRGWSSTSRTPEGLLRLPAGRGVLWYWPSLLTVLACLIHAATLVIGGLKAPSDTRRDGLLWPWTPLRGTKPP